MHVNEIPIPPDAPPMCYEHDVTPTGTKPCLAPAEFRCNGHMKPEYLCSLRPIYLCARHAAKHASQNHPVIKLDGSGKYTGVANA